MEEQSDVALYKTIKKPLLTIISQYLPYKLNLSLAKYSKQYQSLHQFTFETYKYLNLLSRAIDPDVYIPFNQLLAPLYNNPLKIFPIKEMQRANLISLCLIITEMKTKTPIANEVFDWIFKINLHLNHYPYLIINTQREYDYYLQYKDDFKNTLLWIESKETIYNEDTEDMIHTSIKISPNSTYNIIYLFLDDLTLFNYSFPNLKYLVINQMDQQYTSALNQLTPQLDFLMIHTSKDVHLDQIDLSSIKYLVIDAGCFIVNNNYTHFYSKSFPELLSFTINRIINEGELTKDLLQFHYTHKYYFPKTQFPKLKHLDIFEKALDTSKRLSKLTVISHDWITMQRESNDLTLPPFDIDNTIEYWSSLKEVNININAQSQCLLKELSLLRFPKSINGLASLISLTHLNVALTIDVEANVVMTLFTTLSKSLISLKLDKSTKENMLIVFSFEYPQLKELKISFNLDKDIKYINTVLTHPLMKELKSLYIIFPLNCDIEYLFKNYCFDSLDTLQCINSRNPQFYLTKKTMPALRNLTIDIYRSTCDLFASLIQVDTLEYVFISSLQFDLASTLEVALIEKRDSLFMSLKHLAYIYIEK